MFRVNGLLQVAQRATDLPRATAFYRDVLGLPLLAEFHPPGLVFFDLGGSTRLLLEVNAPSTLLYLEVADIHHAVEHLGRAGVVFHQGPHLIHRHDGTFDTAGAEEWMAFFHDSEGNQMALAERRQPPAG